MFKPTACMPDLVLGTWIWVARAEGKAANHYSVWVNGITWCARIKTSNSFICYYTCKSQQMENLVRLNFLFHHWKFEQMRRLFVPVSSLKVWANEKIVCSSIWEYRDAFYPTRKCTGHDRSMGKESGRTCYLSFSYTKHQPTDTTKGIPNFITTWFVS